jgi:hypothetical protein
MKKTIIFLHIPKTAGTSIRSVFNVLYPCSYLKKLLRIGSRGAILEIYDTSFDKNGAKSKLINNIPVFTSSKTKLLIGHFNYGVHESISKSYEYVTFLRDPIKRIISFYNYVKENKKHHLNRVFNDFSLEQLLDEEVTIEFDNLQIRFLCNNGLNIPYGKITIENLNEAKRNIENRIAVFGIVERFDESLLLLKEKLKTRTPFYITKNITNKKFVALNKLDHAFIEKINNLNRFDIELYKHAQYLFNKEVGNIKDLEQRLKQFKTSNRIFNIMFSRIF